MATSSEAIDMRFRRFGYFPQTFIWRGKEYRVEAVERCWTVGSGGRMRYHYFACRCANGTFNVYQDLKFNTWHMEIK